MSGEKIHNEVQGRKETLYWKTSREAFIKGGAVAIGMRLDPTGICQHYQGQLDFGLGFWVSFCFGSSVSSGLGWPGTHYIDKCFKTFFCKVYTFIKNLGHLVNFCIIPVQGPCQSALYCSNFSICAAEASTQGQS